MGAYLAVPVTSKERFEGQGLLRNQDEALQLVYGGAAMQGWRRTMEDAHIAQTGLDQDTGAIFGVFDGHGGAEVALFCQKYMAQELAHIVSASPAAPAPAPAAGASSSPAAAEEAVAAVESALIDVFHRMDEMLRDHSFADEIEQLRGARDAAAEDEGGKGDEGDGLAPMDALEMIKRVFQLKRFMGENGAQGEDGEEGAGEGEGAGGDGGPAAMEADGEGPSGQAQEQEQGAAPGGSGSSGAAPAVAAAAAAAALRRQQQPQRQEDAGGGGGGGAAEARARFIEPADTRIQAGCTAVVAVIRAGHLFVANAGDSRGVLCRAGTAVAMSEDHKPAHETERTRILNAGGFLSEIGGVCRVNGNLNLSRAIGDLKYKTNQTLEPKDQIITAQPDVRRVALQPEDEFLLLACDGVWDVMTNQEAVRFVRERLADGAAPTDVACQLLDACLASDPKEARGVGCDNMTAIVVQLRRSAGAPAAAEA